MNSQLILILMCLLIGLCLRQAGRFPQSTHHVLNGFVIWVSLPSMVIVQMSNLFLHTPITTELFIPISMAWILFSVSAVFFYWLGKKLEWPISQTGALILMAGLGNTSFVGLPLLESILGPKALPIGILVDQGGTFLVLSTLGILVASILSPVSKKSVTVNSVAKSVFTFPPFVALLFSVLIWFFGYSIQGAPEEVLGRFASTLVPLALVSVGFQLKLSLSILKKKWRPLVLGLGFKLFFAPLMFFVLYVSILGSSAFSTQVTIIESAMASMITAGVVADEFGFDSELASLLLGIGIPISLITARLVFLATETYF
jgi:predicted permease